MIASAAAQAGVGAAGPRAATSAGDRRLDDGERERDADQAGLADEDLGRLAAEAARRRARRAAGGVDRPAARSPRWRCPTLSTTAAARPPVAARWARLTCTGAAAARLVVKTPAAGTGPPVVGGDERQVGRARRP